MKKLLLFLLSPLLLAQEPRDAQSQTAPAPSATGIIAEAQDPDWSTLLGMLPPEAYDLLGAPAEVLASRTQGEVLQLVHFHENFLYLFWFRNRVWQIRADQRFQGTFLGLKMGMTPLEVAALLGPPRASENDWLTYELPVLGFPKRLRLKFKEGRLNDLYFFRSDL